MEQLREISKIVTNLRAKKIDYLFSDGTRASNKYKKVAQHIAEGKLKDDDELADAFEVNKNSGQYRVFKTRLKEKLLNNILLFDLNLEDTSTYARSLLICSRNLYCIKLLLALSATQSALSLARRTLQKAESFELWDICLSCALILRRYQSYQGNVSEFENYNHLVKHYSILNAAHHETEECLGAINVLQVNTNVFKDEHAEKAAHYLAKAEQLFANHKTYETGLSYYRIKALYECMAHEYTKALATWKAFEHFLSNYQDYEYEIRMGESALQQMYCYLCLRDYANGQFCALNCEKLFKRHGNNWFLYKEWFFMLAMHTKNYKQASATIQMITSIPHFKQLSRNRQEKWKLFEAYNYIVQTAMPNDAATTAAKTKFRLSSFLNDIPTYNKDKEGFNILILFTQILVQLLDHKYEKLTDNIEALKRYEKRHFRKNIVYRSQTFMKMLFIADECEYKKGIVLQKTKNLKETLDSSVYTPADSYDDLEIVPYIDLWEIVVSLLK